MLNPGQLANTLAGYAMKNFNFMSLMTLPDDNARLNCINEYFKNLVTNFTNKNKVYLAFSEDEKIQCLAGCIINYSKIFHIMQKQTVASDPIIYETFVLYMCKNEPEPRQYLLKHGAPQNKLKLEYSIDCFKDIKLISKAHEKVGSYVDLFNLQI